jgi:type I restriction enzyme M protein
MRTGSAESRALVQKLWGYCKVLRDDGLTYGDYLEQLTYLLFLKMAYEQTQPPVSAPSRIPLGLDWPSLESLSGSELEKHYTYLLSELAEQPGLLGLIFRKSQNRIQNPARLRHLIVNLIGKETWTGLDADLAGDFYEDLLERTAAEGKKGAGQYFTPRSVIRAMVDCIQPCPGESMADPACGTGGFLLIFYEFVLAHAELDRDERIFLRDEAMRGNELVDNTARMCAMNLFLHGIGHFDGDDATVISVGDALLADPARKVDIVLANPPFGTQSSMTVDAEIDVDEDGNSVVRAKKDELTISRPDFWATTSNKQLNFVQHIRSMLKIGGRAAVVVPDNVLFEGEAPTSAGAKVREMLLQECNVHTILRLPTGIFYSPGVKANVIFFERIGAADEPATKVIWVYDFRTNQHFTLKTKKMTREHLEGFVAAYRPGDPITSRQESVAFKRYAYQDIAIRPGFNLDLWADVEEEGIENPDELPAPEVIAEEIAEKLAGVVDQFEALSRSLRARRAVSGEPLKLEELEETLAIAVGHRPDIYRPR